MQKTLQALLRFPPGNWTIEEIHVEAWGSTVILDCVYRYPPDEKPFRLIFDDVRSIEWFLQKNSSDLQEITETQLMSHDLGIGHYKRTARFATPVAEIILSYGQLKVERED